MSGMRFGRLLAGLVTFLMTASNYANTGSLPIKKIIATSDIDPSFALGFENIQIYLDREKKYDIYNIQAADFRPLGTKALNAGFFTKPIWLRFSLKNDQTLPAEILLEAAYPNLDTIYFYSPDQHSGYKISVAGDNISLREREFRAVDNIFPIYLMPRQEATFYIRIETEGTVTVPFTLWEAESYPKHAEFLRLLTGLVIGILLIMSFYNLFLYAGIRDNAYLFYSGWTFFSALFISINLGVAQTFLWPELLWWKNYSYPFSVSTAVAFLNFFTRSFLDTRRNAPVFDKIFLALGVISLLCSLSVFLNNYMLSIRWATFMGLPSGIVALIAGFITLKRGFRPARYYLLAWSFLLTAIVIYVLKSFAVLPENIFTNWSLRFGAVFESLLLSFGLADRINIMKREKEFAQQEAIESLKRADKLKDEFLANTSHELRTPLNGIIGIADSLQEQIATGKYDKLPSYIGLISSSASRLYNLVNDILDYSSLRNSEIRLRLKPVSLHDSAEIAIELLQPMISAKNLKVMNKISIGLVPVLADEGRLQQILLNLLGNAVKFTETGEVSIGATLDEKSGRVKISVQDTGIGIEKSRQEKIFNAFEQADSGLDRGYQGIGLGLSITRRLLELHSSAITVDSEPGKGSLFEFSLPLAQAGSTPVPAETLNRRKLLAESKLSLAVGETTDSNVSGEAPDIVRILAVDDEPVNLEVLRLQLNSNGFEVRTALDATSTLQMLESGYVPDVMLVDVMMPGVSGYDLATILRQKYSLSELPIIMITALSRPEDIEKGLNSGANDYLVKPVQKSELIARVRTMAALRKGHAEALRLKEMNLDLEHARYLQQSILPREIPSSQYGKTSVFYESLSSIGGDLYDFMSEKENTLGIFIADVSGHGIHAALLANMAKIAFTEQRANIENPSALLEGMNQTLRSSFGSNFLTAGYLYLDYSTMKMRYASAGHPHIYLLRTNEPLIRIKPRGRMIGPFGTVSSITEETSIQPGDTFVLYTDGLVEIKQGTGRGDISYSAGQKLLEQVLSENYATGAGQLLEKIKTAFRLNPGTGNIVNDDITIVVTQIL